MGDVVTLSKDARQYVVTQTSSDIRFSSLQGILGRFHVGHEYAEADHRAGLEAARLAKRPSTELGQRVLDFSMTLEELKIRQAETLAPGRIQCGGCLLYFDRDAVKRVCNCGAYQCANCEAQNRAVACYCDC